MDKLTELIEHWENHCNRYTNGQCHTRRCMVRGGWIAGPPDYSAATCEEHETVLALRSQNTPDSLRDG